MVYFLNKNREIYDERKSVYKLSLNDMIYYNQSQVSEILIDETDENKIYKNINDRLFIKFDILRKQKSYDFDDDNQKMIDYLIQKFGDKFIYIKIENLSKNEIVERYISINEFLVLINFGIY